MEVHPPDHPIMTWKQFFVHMATICLGLLIALGLEHVAEMVHEHEQLKQANEALDREIRANILVSQYETIEIRREHEMYAGDLADLEYLKAHPHTALHQLPAPLFWGFLEERPSTAAWDTLRSGPVAALKPVHEMESMAHLYFDVNRLADAESHAWDANAHAQMYVSRAHDPSTLSSAEIDQWIAAVQQLLVAHYQEAIALHNLCQTGASTGFKPCLTREELWAWSGAVAPKDLVSIYGPGAQAFVDRQLQQFAQEQDIDRQLETLDKEQ